MTYKEIHIWDFPPTRTTVYLNGYRKQLIREFIDSFRTWREAVSFLNFKAKEYGDAKHHNVGDLGHWMKGVETKSKKERRIPLWCLIEISKRLSKELKNENSISKQMEKNILYISSRSGVPVRTKFPVFLTPELVSVVFHFCGDGYLSGKGRQANYTQVNVHGLKNFERKIKNCFGEFETNQNAFQQYKFLIPRVIADFYRERFQLGDCGWATARIPEEIKTMEKDFLVAGLAAFIVDEGHLGDSIEIYSSNKNFLLDIKEVCDKLGYRCSEPRFKAKYVSDHFRLYISTKSLPTFNSDIADLSKEFPTCDLAHKQPNLNQMTELTSGKSLHVGITKEKITLFLSKKNSTIQELCKELKIKPGSVREHLRDLEKQRAVSRVGIVDKQKTLWGKVS